MSDATKHGRWLALFVAVGLQAGRDLAPPVPIWPRDDRPPEPLNGHYVFWDPDKWQIVVVLTGGVRGAVGAPPEVTRVPFRNRFALHVAATVAADGQTYIYSYSAENGRDGKDPVTSWDFVTPCIDPDFRIDEANSHCTKTLMPTATQDLLPHVAEPACHATCFPDDAVRPGSGPAEITVRSRARPGLTTFSAGNYPPFDVPLDWPEVVLDQLTALGGLRWSNRHCATIGPRFPPGTLDRAIATDFLEGIDDLVGGGDLTAGSPVVAELRSDLSRIARDSASPSPAIHSRPGTELEAEMLRAAMLSLGLRSATH